MRVFLAGASGVIGQRLVPRLVQAGHVVGGMTRSPNKTELLSHLGAEPILCDVFDREALIRAVGDFKPDVVLDELTDLPDDAARISERADLNARIRTEGTRNLIEAARRSGSPKIVAQSVAWQLPDGPDARAVAELERSVLAEGGVVLRYGQFYGPGTYNEQQPPKEPRVQIDRAAERTVEALGEPTSVVVITDTQEGQKSSPADLVKALHSAFGNHHARAVHSKGIILEGFFTPSKEAASLTKAVHLQDATSQVVVRFSDFTGIPDIADTNPLSHPRGMAIKFKLPNNASTDLVTHSFNGFPTATSDQFRELLLAIAASGPDAPKPTALDKFLETHPVARTFLTTQKPASVSYATLSYFGVNAFEFTNQEGKTCLIRYQIIPEAGEEFLSKEQLANAAPNYLQKEIVGRVAKGPLKFKMQVQIAREGDDPKNPSLAWPDNRRVVALGTITIDKLASNTVVEDKALAFIPNDLPAGIAPADPMIDFRSKAYPISVAERQ